MSNNSLSNLYKKNNKRYPPTVSSNSTNIKTNSKSKKIKNFLSFLLKLIVLLLIITAVILLIKVVYYYASQCTEKKELKDYMLDFTIDPCLYREEKTSYVERELKQEDEVFHLSNQDYTFPQAKCKCNAYGARLATREEITDSYNKGASWCSYGWSEGQNAYYPTQKCDFDKLQRLSKKDRFKCGLPGINGGFFFYLNLKFGINCYGIKPKGKTVVEKDAVCNDEKGFCEREVNQNSAKILNTDYITAFNKTQWSQFDN